MNREAIFTALTTRLQAQCALLKSVGRRDLDPENLAPEDQPAACVLSVDQAPIQERGKPARWTLRAVLKVWAHCEMENSSPDTQLNQILDQVEAALKTQAGERITSLDNPTATTLGGLVERCWISGAVDFYQGTSAQQAGIVVPIEMLAT